MSNIYQEKLILPLVDGCIDGIFYFTKFSTYLSIGGSGDRCGGVEEVIWKDSIQLI